MKSPFHYLAASGFGSPFASGGPDFSPADLAGLVLWLKADAGTWQDSALTTAAAADADPVGGWVNQTGSGINGTQTTAGFRPTLRTGVLNGRPILRTDGSDDLLNLGTNVAALAINGNLTVLAVARKTTPSVYGAFLSYQAAAGTNNSYEVRYDNANPAHLELVHADAAGVENFASTTTLTNNTWYLLEVVRSGTAISFLVNGSAAGSGTATRTPTSTASSRGSVGDRAFSSIAFPGDLAELLVYSGAKTATERANLRAYLNAAWAVY